MTAHRGFTLIELITVIVTVGILSGVAIPRFIDMSTEARDAADEGALAGIRTALNLAHIDNRESGAPTSEWITAVTDVAGTLEAGRLPEGIERRQVSVGSPSSLDWASELGWTLGCGFGCGSAGLA